MLALPQEEIGCPLSRYAVTNYVNELFIELRDLPASDGVPIQRARVTYRDFRAGGARYSEADVSMATRLLGYQPTHDLHADLAEALAWYLREHQAVPSPV